MVAKILSSLLLVVGLNFLTTNPVSADLLQIDDFSVGTGTLFAEGDQGTFEASESTAAFGGPLAGVTTRTVSVFSDTAPATVEVSNGEFIFQASTNDAAGQSGYSTNGSAIPLDFLGDGLYIDVTGLTPGNQYAVTFLAAGLDESEELLFATSTVFFETAGIHSALFSSFVNLDPGNPVDFGAVEEFGFVVENLSNNPGTIAIGGTGLVSIPEPATGIAIVPLLFGLALNRRRSQSLTATNG